MFQTNAFDPVQYPISIVGTAGPASPVRPVRPTSASYRTHKGQVLTVAGFVLASAVAGFGLGAAASHAPTAPATAPDLTPVTGEFRLAPGLAQPPGIAFPNIRAVPEPQPGDFRLAPGNQEPPGLVAGS